MRTLKDSAGVLITQYLALAVTILIGIITARYLGPEGKGLYVLTFVLPGLFVTFGNVGLGQAIVYNLAKYPERRGEVVGSIFIVSGVFAGVVTVGAYMSLPYLSRALVPSVDMRFLRIGLITLPTSFWLLCATNCFRGIGRYSLYNAVALMSKLAFLLFLIVFIVILKGGPLEAVYSNVLASLILTAVTLVGVVRYVTAGSRTFSATFVRPLISYGARVHTGYVLQTLEHRVDILLISRYLISPTAVGLYSVGVTLAELVLRVSEAAGTVWLQRVSAETSGQIGHKTAGLSRIVVLISLIVTVVLAVAAYPAIYLFYGSDFLPSYLPFLILLPGVFTRAPGQILGSHLQGIGRPGTVSWISGISLTLNLALNIVLIPVYGISGAALASSVSYSIRSVVTLYMFSRLSGYSLSQSLLPRKEDWLFLIKVLTTVPQQLISGYSRSFKLTKLLRYERKS